MAIFLSQLHIRVFDSESGIGIPRIALKLTLFTRRKGNYTIPMVTNSVGEVHLSAKYVWQSIKDDWELFPMDYESTLEKGSADAEIKICTPEDVQRTIEAMKMFRSASTISDELIRAFECSGNNRYVPGITRFNVEESSKISMGICRVQAAEKSKTPAQWRRLERGYETQKAIATNIAWPVTRTSFEHSAASYDDNLPSSIG